MRLHLLLACVCCALAQDQTIVHIQSGLITGKETGEVRAWLGMHRGEIPFVFDNVGTGLLNLVATEADRRMGDIVSSYWVHFAKTGNPNGPALPPWREYKAATDKLLELGPEIVVREHFRKPQLDLIEQVRSSMAR